MVVNMYFLELIVVESISDVLFGNIGGEVGKLYGFLGHNYKERDYRGVGII